MPLTLPYPSTLMGLLVMCCKSRFTPSPSGTTCVAQAQVSQSVAMRMRRLSPVAVGHTSPVKVCTRTGTRASHAAIMPMSPALGVMVCSIVGRSLRSTRHMRHSERKSRNGEM